MVQAAYLGPSQVGWLWDSWNTKFLWVLGESQRNGKGLAGISNWSFNKNPDQILE